jgi:SAM-dependent methyltransferase
MLYHCPDIPAAVSELRRVLREDGVLVAVTNGAEHLKELRAIRAAVVPRAASVVSERFSLENGAAFLAAAFDDVQTLRFDGELRVPAVEPVSRYVASMMTWADDPDASSAMARIDAEVAAAIARDGVFRVRTLVGVFVCR